ncbi:hypothetical protein CS022_08100 [Veronia nyctiphanis]|uniref:Uncharacterized protein n=1 Tax=Veronia nyctiphanis TaxID=1278244 RepID=A0A4Q0YRF4_9GAMM|nr:biotin/lipoyl-binding protein [Veronia nyctiphanis]RXJ73692.1 hypothetical protein CS022_08100 [Veronia nyctiphanis]
MMSEPSANVTLEKHQKLVTFCVAVWLQLFRLFPTVCLKYVFAIKQRIKRESSKTRRQFSENLVLIMPDQRSNAPELSQEFSRFHAQCEQSRRLLPKTRIGKLKNQLKHADKVQTLGVLENNESKIFMFIHPFGCLQSIMLSLVNHIAEDRTVVLLLDSHSKHHINRFFLKDVVSRLLPAHNIHILCNTDSDIEITLATLIASESKLMMLMSSNINFGEKKAKYTHLFSKQVIGSAVIEELANTHSESAAFFSVCSQLSLINRPNADLNITSLCGQSERSVVCAERRPFNQILYSDLQDKVTARVTQWQLWLDLESFYGRQNIQHVEEDMKSNFDKFVSGRVETPPILRFFSYCIVSVFATAILILINVHYTASDSAVGYLLGEENKVDVKLSSSGQVVDVRVQEGDNVEKGDLLFTLEATQSIDGSSPLGRKVTQQLEEDIERLEKNMAYLRLDHQKNTQSLQTEIQAKSAQRISMEKIINKQLQHIALMKKHVMRIRDLHLKKLATLAQYESEQLNLINAEKELANHELSKSALLTDIARLNNELEKSDYKIEVVLNNEAMKISAVKKQLVEISEKQTTHVYAERDGTVNNLKVSLGDSTVVDGRSVMEIVPIDDGVVKRAVIFIPTNILNNTEVGQDVSVMVDAFPVDEFGIFQGKIIKMSSSTYKHSDFIVDLPRRSLYYKADIEIYTNNSKKQLPVEGFKTGMLINADILRPEVSLFEWLFEPFFKAFTRML